MRFFWWRSLSTFLATAPLTLNLSLTTETVRTWNLGASFVILSYALASRKTALLSFSFTFTLVQLFFFALPPAFLLTAEAEDLPPLSPLPPLASLPFYCLGPYKKQKLTKGIFKVPYLTNGSYLFNNNNWRLNSLINVHRVIIVIIHLILY